MTIRFNRVTRIAFACLLIASLTVVSSVPAIALSSTTTLEESPLSLSSGQSAGVTPTLPETGSQLKDDVLPGDSEPVRIAQNDESVPVFIYPEAVLWDNGPLVTHPGGGYNGADASVVQTASGMSTYGFGNQLSEGNRMADDFVITGLTDWEIENITFFAYQTGSPTSPSTITGVYFQIWNGSPDDPGSSIVWGDLTTNRLVSSTWTNIYRTLDTSLANSDRPIMANIVSVGVILSPGVYWLDWTTNGSLTSGPWAPPITILGQTSTGNAMQFTDAWAPALDTGTSTPQGMPFIVEGVIAENPNTLVYLPCVLNTLPVIPTAPVLNAISNGDGDGNYTISWSLSAGASTYTLEEDDNLDFSSPTTVYSGSSTSDEISGRDLGTYYYRVRASNVFADSDWSNIESVVVTVLPPDCPQAGAWSGITSQGRNIHFVVETSPTCRIAAHSLSISIRDSCYYDTTTEFSNSYPIVNNHFDTGGVSVSVEGDFTSLTTASGSFSLYMANPFPPPYNCSASGTWTTSP
jgi:hypothetical protein